MCQCRHENNEQREWGHVRKCSVSFDPVFRRAEYGSMAQVTDRRACRSYDAPTVARRSGNDARSSNRIERALLNEVNTDDEPPSGDGTDYRAAQSSQRPRCNFNWRTGR